MFEIEDSLDRESPLYLQYSKSVRITKSLPVYFFYRHKVSVDINSLQKNVIRKKMVKKVLASIKCECHQPFR